MKKYFILIVSLNANYLLAQKNSIHKIKSLVGTWQMNTPKGVVMETWKYSNDSTLKGISHFIKNNDTTIQETIEIVFRNEKMYYIPTVNGQNNNSPISFLMIKNENNRYIFENKEHDFPQRIIYNIQSKNSIEASIEGVIAGELKIKKISFNRLMK